MNFYLSCLAFFLAMWAVCHTLLSGFIKFSARQKASGSSRLTTTVMKPARFMYSWFCGCQWWSSIIFDRFREPCRCVVWQFWRWCCWWTLLLGTLVYSSIITSRYSPLGSGTQKSISMYAARGNRGSLVGFSASRVVTCGGLTGEAVLDFCVYHFVKLWEPKEVLPCNWSLVHFTYNVNHMLKGPCVWCQFCVWNK